MKTMRDVVQRLRAEFLEMPGLHLTAEQVQRLCGIERTVCHSVLDALTKAKFLYHKSDGHYARLTEGHVGDPPYPAKVELRTDPVEEHGESVSPVERRRGVRSGAEMREQRHCLERRWDEEHRPPEAHQERGSAEDADQPVAVAVPATRKLAS
jgi:hypothetical protein